MSFTSGENVGPYRILEQLGQGGMATVFKAYHPALDRYVAIKALHPAFSGDPNFLGRFQREARLVARLEHPNIVPIYDAAEHEGRPYLVMKFIEGDTLKSHLGRGSLPKGEMVRIVEAVGFALTYAHKQGILHRDIKPSNVIIAKDGQVYLADFGLARIASAGESTLSSDMFIGTPQYISPEQAQGRRDLDEGTDIYSFGVLLYEIVVGRVPFTADTPYAIIHDHIFSPLPMPRKNNPEVSDAMERVLLKALAKERSERFEDINTLVQAFKAAFDVSTRPEIVKGDDTSKTQRTPAEVVIPIQPNDNVEETRVTQAPELIRQEAGPEDRLEVAADDVSASPEPAPGQPESAGVTNQAASKPKKNRRRWILMAGVFIVLCMCLGVALGRANKNKPTAEKPQSPAENSIAAAQTQVALSPGDPRTHLRLSGILYDNGKLDEAEKEFRAALDLAGEDFDFYLEAGEVLIARQAWLPASQVYLRVAKMSTGPIPPESKIRMHEAWYKASVTHEFFEAVPFEELLKVDPLMAGLTKLRSELYGGGRVRAALGIEELVQRNPDFLEARLLQAELFLKSENKNEALRVLDQLLSHENLTAWIEQEARLLKDLTK